MKDVTILLPAYQEEEAIGKVIDEVREVLPSCRILVAYQPGLDGTENILAQKGVEWITEHKIGKGYAVRSAIRSINTPFVIMMDADFTYPAKHIPELLENLKDVAVGYRHIRERGAMSSVNFFGNKALSLLASILFKKRIYDVCSGMWAFRKEVLDGFELESGGFTLEVDLFINCIRNKCRINQIPIEYRGRLDGSLPKLRIRDGVNIGVFLIKKRLNWVENIAMRLCPGEGCEHYRGTTKYPRKCYYEPQCWRGRISNFAKVSRAKRYRESDFN